METKRVRFTVDVEITSDDMEMAEAELGLMLQAQAEEAPRDESSLYRTGEDDPAVFERDWTLIRNIDTQELPNDMVVVDAYDTARIRIELRSLGGGRASVWWTDGPREGEDEFATLAEARMAHVDAIIEDRRLMAEEG